MTDRYAIHHLMPVINVGRDHLLHKHGDDGAIDLADSLEEALHQHARWLATTRDLVARLEAEVDNLRSASGRRDHECQWCKDFVATTAEALLLARGGFTG